MFTFFNFYAICFLIGFFYAIVTFVFSGIFDFAGGDHDIGGLDHDVGAGGGVDAGGLDGGAIHFSPLSPFVIALFISVFGATGMISLEVFKVHEYFSLLIALVVALGLSGLVFMGFNYVFERTQGGLEIRHNDMVGYEADVITQIPAGGMGEISYVVGGMRMNSPARSEDGSAVERGTSVRILKVVGNTCVVAPSKES